MPIFTAANNIPTIEKLALASLPKGSLNYYWLKIISDGLGSPICIPLMVAKGIHEGPVLGLTAAVHGNEINGIPVIQRLFAEVDVSELSGTIIGVPVVNVPSFIRKKRRFNDGVDLNHIMPGKVGGNVSEIYAHRFVNRLVKHFDYLIDLHTASYGRINSYYVRADMEQASTRQLAMLQNADIIVHNPPFDGTLRGAADAMGIPAITVEVGNPGVFQKRLIRSGHEGIHNVLCHLNMIEDDLEPANKPTILCKKSYWIYTERGGLLTVHANLVESLEKGQKMATLRNVYGQTLTEYTAPENGVVIGKSVSPVNQSGGRVLHLGVV